MAEHDRELVGRTTHSDHHCLSDALHHPNGHVPLSHTLVYHALLFVPSTHILTCLLIMLVLQGGDLNKESGSGAGGASVAAEAAPVSAPAASDAGSASSSPKVWCLSLFHFAIEYMCLAL